MRRVIHPRLLRSSSPPSFPRLPGVALNLVHKKINISDPVVAFEHEQFSRKRILAVTLSRHASHDPHLRSSVLDR